MATIATDKASAIRQGQETAINGDNHMQINRSVKRDLAISFSGKTLVHNPNIYIRQIMWNFCSFK